MAYPSKDTLERMKLTMDVVRPAVVISVALLVVANLTWLTTALVGKLEKAGFNLKEVDALGMKIERLQTKLQAAQDSVSATNEAVAKAQAELSCAASGCSAAQIDSAKAQLSNASQQVKSTIADTRAIAAQLDQVNAAPGTSDWVAVISADPDLGGAKFEVDRAQKKYAGSAELVRRGNYYRTVIHFNSAADVKNALADIEAMTHRPPYLRDFSQWCPDPSIAAPGLRLCSQGSGD